LLLLVVGIVTAVALYYAWANWAGARELQSVLAELERKKESVRLEDFIPPHVPDDQNVAAAPIFREYVASTNNSRLGRFLQTWKILGTLSLKDQRLINMAKKINLKFSGDESAARSLILEALNQTAPVLEEVREALRRPKVEWPIDYSNVLQTPMNYITPCLDVAKMFCGRALAELELGLPDKAAQDTMAILAMAEVVVPPRMLISELVRELNLQMASDVICDGLRRGAWTDSNLSDFSKSFPEENLTVHIADGLRVDRVGVQMWMADLKLSLAALEMINTLNPQDEGSKRFFKLICQLRPAGWAHRDRAHHIVAIQQLIECLSANKGISPNEVDRIETSFRKPSKWDRFTTPLSAITSPVFIGILKKVVYAQTQLESTRTACAVERYRLVNKRLPASLGDLVPAFLPAVPNDPITGRPLLYKPKEDGAFVVYGVGWNQIDDGGSVQPTPPKKPIEEADWGVDISKG
ncbi:MAG: hypothetical protein WCO97_11450, partial [bacterium]